MAAGSVLGNVFGLLEQTGVFQYMLPFLVIFALVYGILLRTKIFENNNAISVIISLSVGLLSLQFDAVPIFFANIFPRLGIALVVILVVIIMIGLFMPKEKWVIYTIFTICAIALLLVLKGSFGETFGFGDIGISSEILALLIFGLIVIIIAAILSPSKEPTKFSDIVPKPLKDMLG